MLPFLINKNIKMSIKRWPINEIESSSVPFWILLPSWSLIFDKSSNIIFELTQSALASDTLDSVTKDIVSWSWDLWDLTDVTLTNPTNWQVITYNSSTQEWENQALPWGWDMLKSVYDPTNVNWDAFDRTNHTWDEDLTNVNLTIPNWTAPVIDSNWQIAIDTSVAWLSHGILRYYSWEELFNLPLPVSNLASLNNGYIPKFNATTQEFELSPENTWPWDTINNNINTIKKDSTAWTSDTYWVLTGAVDWVNTTFTVSNGKYVSWTLTVYRNGARQIQWVSEDWVETNPATWTFDFNTPPLSWDAIDVEYSNLEATAESIIVEKDVTTVSTNYTALISDRVILVNASAGDVTITLPEISELDSIWISIKKIDISWNIVNIVTPNSETIDNETSIDILAPYQSRSILSDWINYFVI